MTLKYSYFKKYHHEYHDGSKHFSIVGGELFGQKLSAHQHRDGHNRVVYLSKDYVLKIDVPSTYSNEFLQQSKREYAVYKTLSKKQKKYVPELIEAGQLYLPLFEGEWVGYVVTKRVKGKHPPCTYQIDENLMDMFWDITEDFHTKNVIVDKEGKQWLVDLGY